MHYTGHGGACCGISHVFGINETPRAANRYVGFSGTSRDCLERVIHTHGRNTERVLEVVTAQDVYGDGTCTEQTENWEDTLVSLGFQRVSSFVNSNSNNVCTVWHKHPNLTVYGNTVERIVEREVEVPAHVERRAVLTEYCPNFRVNGRGRMFSSLLEVRDAYPLIRQIDRRTVFTDGSTEWETNVD